MRFLIEWKETVYDESGIPEWIDTDEGAVAKTEKREGILHGWGVKSELLEGKVGTFTVAIVEDKESGGIILLDPEEIKIIDKIIDNE